MTRNTTPPAVITDASILDDPADILVCPVNCYAGVMGKGLAKQFADRFLGGSEVHRRICNEGLLDTGLPHVARVAMQSLDGEPQPPRLICFFATKYHWREPSQYRWIREGLARFQVWIEGFQMGRMDRYGSSTMTIAIPALGCGLGGLEQNRVYTEIVEWASCLPYNVEVNYYSARKENP